MPIEKLHLEFTFTEDRLNELQAVVPEAFADGKINWDTLREALGEYLEDEEQEYFGLTWPGKREARRLAAMPPKGTLVPQPGHGANEDTTHNIFVEGDNLEVLKLLQKSYAGRVKMIYIDPPYNTGNDFVYPDNYNEPLDAYLQRTNQIDETGKKLTTNTRASGRFHSNWLNMIYPRLMISRNLLTDDGAIFVSIDDNEFYNLRIALDEIFGGENFIGCIVWQHSIQGKNDVKGISIHHNYILVYSKTDAFVPELMPRTEEHNKAYSNPDKDPRGLWRSGDVRSPHYRENLRFTIISPSGYEIQPPPNGWRWSQELVNKKIRDKEIIFVDNETRIVRKIYLSEQKGRVPESIWFGKEVGTTRQASRELKDLFEGVSPFDTPKPTSLLEKMFHVAGLLDNDIVLDFFAGSCSTAQAVLQKNRETSISRRFIVVQLPELTPKDSVASKAGYKTVADIGKERIRRAIGKLRNEQEGQMNLQSDEDLGFKVFCLDRSNFKSWQPYEGATPARLETLFDRFKTPLVEGWQRKNLLTEVLLLQGFPLDSQVTHLDNIESNQAQRIRSAMVGHDLYVCLDDEIQEETIKHLRLSPEDVLVCLDNALSDEAKIRLSDQCNLKVI